MEEKKAIAVTGKITIADFEKLNKVIKENPHLNKSYIVSKAIYDYLHKKGDEEFDKELETLKTENQQLKTKVDGLIQENETLKAETQALNDILESREPGDNPSEMEALHQQIENQQTELETLKTENETLKTQPEKTRKLTENQLLINLPPTLQPFLIEIANRETNRTGHKVTKEMVLLNLFWAQVSRGPGDHLPLTFSPSEIRKRLEIVKQQQKPTAE
ncbi:MAG: hypothetical protein GXO88_07845 [Chlorobi bacterium]|nr:hypothetical protein [Chlorobiota bacterium]